MKSPVLFVLCGLFVFLQAHLTLSAPASAAKFSNRGSSNQCQLRNMEKVAACKCYEISIGVSPDVSKLDICKDTFGDDLSSLQNYCHRFNNPGHNLDNADDDEIMDAISEVADDCRAEYSRAFLESRVVDFDDHHHKLSRTVEGATLNHGERLTIVIRFRTVIIIIYF